MSSPQFLKNAEQLEREFTAEMSVTDTYLKNGDAFASLLNRANDKNSIAGKYTTYIMNQFKIGNMNVDLDVGLDDISSKLAKQEYIKKLPLDEDDIFELFSTFALLISDYIHGNFPIHSTDDATTAHSTTIIKSHPDKRIGDLVTAMEWLKDNGWIWQDLHDENVMMRPSTKELVMSDIGNFEEA